LKTYGQKQKEEDSDKAKKVEDSSRYNWHMRHRYRHGALASYTSSG
jgi:hypothetical protein